MISDIILWESDALIQSLFWGMIFAFGYNTIRIFRRLVHHKSVLLMSIEDIIYWICVGIKVFAIYYTLNNGIIRGFILCGFIIGAVVFQLAFGSIYVKYVTKMLLFILAPLKKIIEVVKIHLCKLFIRNEGNKHEV